MKIIGNKNALHTPEFHKKKLMEKRIRVAIITIIILIVTIVPVLILRHKNFQITNIEIVGNVVTKNEEIQAIISKNLSGNYLWIIPRTNTLLYPKNKIIKDLMELEPRLSKIEVNTPSVQSVIFNVSERSPRAMYCNDVSNTSTPADCYFIDSNGFIFSEAPAFSGGVYMVYTSDPKLDSPLRTNYFEKEKFLLIDNFVTSLPNIDLYPKIFESKRDEYSLILSNNAIIRWNIKQDLTTIYSNLDTLIHSESFKKDGGFNNILYLEIIGGKMTFKYK